MAKKKPARKVEAPKKPKIGRPTLYTPELGEKLCELFVTGRTFREIEKMDGMPSKDAICSWLAKHDEFRQQYARAREAQALIGEDETIEIADDSSDDYVERVINGRKQKVYNKQHVDRSKLRVDTRKWLMSKRFPKRYGDKVDLHHSGEVSIAEAIKAGRERARAGKAQA